MLHSILEAAVGYRRESNSSQNAGDIDDPPPCSLHQGKHVQGHVHQTNEVLFEDIHKVFSLLPLTEDHLADNSSIVDQAPEFLLKSS